jgi:proteasome lid subunit RPN8/RPN11
VIESSIVIYKEKIIDYAKGTAASVEFDFERIWDIIKKDALKISSELLSFVHVHPPGIFEASVTDINCINGFNMAFGECTMYLFSIIRFHNSDLFDISHGSTVYVCNAVAAYRKATGYLNISNDQLLFLKYLSYSKEIENANI